MYSNNIVKLLLIRLQKQNAELLYKYDNVRKTHQNNFVLTGNIKTFW